jgi:O-antigen/teichoic acid export membrane protein
MDLDVRSRLRKGFSANIYNQFVTVIVQLVGVPILLHAWGAQLYGEWLILFAIPAYLSMTDLGFSQSAANDMTARVACGDRAGALSVFQSLIALVYLSITIVFILSSLLVFGLPLEKWINAGALRIVEVRWVLWLLAAEVFARLPDGINHAGFRSTGDYSFHVVLHGTMRLIQFASLWLAALNGGGLVAAAAAFFGVRLIGTVAFALLLKQRHPWLIYGLRHADRIELRRLFKPALANVAIPLAQGLNIQGMVLAVGAVLGPIAVVVFSTLRTLTRLVLQIVYSVSHAAEPELAAAYGSKDRALGKSLFVNTLSAGLWLAVFAAAGLALFGDSILSIWTHGKVAMDRMLFAWLLASSVASVLWYGSLIALKAANKHIKAASIFVLSSAGAVAVGLALMLWTSNLANAGLALLLMDGTMTLYTINAASRLMNTRPGSNLIQAFNLFALMRLVVAKHKKIKRRLSA